jgi:hypothetical protein
MPLDSTPRSLARLILKSPGSLAPTVATGTRWPAATLAAPQTMPMGSPSPKSTWQTRSFSASGCGATLCTWPTTTPLNAGAAGSTASTSSPDRLS